MKLKLYIIGGMLVLGVAIGVVVAMATGGGKAAADMCAKTGTVHSITIKNDKTSQAHLDAKQCDVLKVTNLDDEEREMAFGFHEHHEPYNGITERILNKNQSFSVVLAETGHYRFHDHIHDEVGATFTVTK